MVTAQELLNDWLNLDPSRNLNQITELRFNERIEAEVTLIDNTPEWTSIIWPVGDNRLDVRVLTNLQSLISNVTNITSLDVSDLSQLRTLNLNNNPSLDRIDGLGGLTSLTSINISTTAPLLTVFRQAINNVGQGGNTNQPTPVSNLPALDLVTIKLLRDYREVLRRNQAENTTISALPGLNPNDAQILQIEDTRPNDGFAAVILQITNRIGP